MLPATIITKIKIRDSSIVIYPSYELFDIKRGRHESSKLNLGDNRVKGYLSKNSSRKMRDLVQNWTNCIKSKMKSSGGNIDSYISFLTLTLPSKQTNSDLEIKRKILDPFLKKLFRKYLVTAWIWKAESQINGNIHFHVLVNKFCAWKEIRKDWNNAVQKFGYIDEFEKKHGHRDPNSTDAHGLYKDKKGEKISFIGAYMAKYLSKGIEDGYRGIEGRVWGCSDNLKYLKTFSDVQDSRFGEFIDFLIESPSINKFQGDYFRILEGNWRIASDIYPDIIEKIDFFYLKEFEKTLIK